MTLFEYDLTKNIWITCSPSCQAAQMPSSQWIFLAAFTDSKMYQVLFKARGTLRELSTSYVCDQSHFKTHEVHACRSLNYILRNTGHSNFWQLHAISWKVPCHFVQALGCQVSEYAYSSQKIAKSPGLGRHIYGLVKLRRRPPEWLWHLCTAAYVRLKQTNRPIYRGQTFLSSL